MDFGVGVLFLVGLQLALLHLCASQTYACSYGGDIRLVNGTGPYEGRVEICYSSVWTTVCHFWWDYSDARVVCAQLHYPPQDALALRGSTFGQGNGSILERINCRGSELRLIDCSITDYPDYWYYPACNHADNAGVRCLSCNTHGAVRLSGSSSQNRGRVEICVNGVWGTVCDDDWDSTDASVVCGQLGFSRFGSRGYSGAPYGPGRGPIHLDDVMCRGDEQHLIDCFYTNNTFGRDCTHGRDAAVYCQPTLQCEEGDLRLVGGRTIYRERVEICVNETWGTICYNNWGQPEATVTCRQLGFSRHGAIAQLAIDFGYEHTTHYSNILCTGRELWLMDCQHDSSTGSCFFIAGVQCSFDYLPSPTRFQATCEESNLCTLSWQRPPMYYRRQGTLLNYFINCSTLHKDARRDESVTNITLPSTNVTLHVWLQPYRFYNCCVAAVNEAGRGNSTCQTIITHEAAPTVAPTNIEAHQLIDNSTSVFLSWRSPPAQYQNGIVRSYYVEFNSTNAWLHIQYTTQDQYLLIANLQPYVEYTCRVAAYTIGRGPFSEPLTIILNSEIGIRLHTEEITWQGVQITSSQGNATVTVATISTLLVVVVIMVGVYFAVHISYKLATRKKSAPGPVHNDIVYETVEDPKPSDSENTLKERIRQRHTCTAKQNEHDYRDGSLTPPLPPRTYSLSSSLDKIDNLENRQLQNLSTDLELKDQNPQSENTYQALILPRHTATTDSEYQSLTQFRQREVKL